MGTKNHWKDCERVCGTAPGYVIHADAERRTLDGHRHNTKPPLTRGKKPTETHCIFTYIYKYV